MKVVVVGSGELAPGDAIRLEGADLVVAADGGAVRLDQLGVRPDLLVGDLDSTDASLVDRLVAAGTGVERHPIDKDASDTELAMAAAVAAGATEIVMLSMIGGDRLDHALANVLLLADPGWVDRDVSLVHGAGVVRVLRGGSHLPLHGRIGDLVSLLPVGGDADGVDTDGLRWPLTGASLRMGRSRGLSNEIVAVPASVRLAAGTLLVIETAHREEPSR